LAAPLCTTLTAAAPSHVGVGVSTPLSHFTKVKKLGEGGFGKVFLVQDKRDQQSYVMKEIDLSKLDAKGRKEATKECAFLARMSHPNIISYKEWFEVAGAPSAGPWGAQAWPKGQVPGGGGRGNSTLYICMSYADGGDLEARIKVQQKLSASGRFHPFPEQQIIDWFIQTALAIKHIHDRKILHRDIKSQNIFLTKLNLVKLGGQLVWSRFASLICSRSLLTPRSCSSVRFRHRTRSQQHDGEGDDANRHSLLPLARNRQ
jgi:serine/threonine protein kinase